MDFKKNINIINRKAKFEYAFQDVLEAGMMLKGTELKSIRLNNVNLKDAFCTFIKGELYVRNIYIAPYEQGTVNSHEVRRDIKLLLKRRELRKWIKKTEEKGYTIVPYKMYFSERGFAKLEIALAQGKKTYDKRATIKDRDNKRELDRMKKMY
ncbi:MAG: SsrA-binding protein SmpB [Saprospiraceae bacterium]